MDIQEEEILKDFLIKHSVTTVDFNDETRLLELIRYTVLRTYNFYFKQDKNKNEQT